MLQAIEEKSKEESEFVRMSLSAQTLTMAYQQHQHTINVINATSGQVSCASETR
jgi:hypothetical protein